MPAIHENLKLLRQAKGMTQADVGDAVHVSRQTISSYESGRTQPDLEMLKSLAEVYQVEIQAVLYGGDRYQRKIKAIKYTIYGLIMVLFIGLLVHSGLLWAMDTYFQLPNGTLITDSNQQIVEIRFLLRDTASFISFGVTTVFWLGCLILLYPVAVFPYPPPLKKRFVWFLGLAAAAYGLVLPWFLLSGSRAYGIYLHPVRNTLPAMFLVFMAPVLASIIKKSLGQRPRD